MNRLGIYSLGFVLFSIASIDGQVRTSGAAKGTSPAFQCAMRIDASELKIVLDGLRVKKPEAVERLTKDPALRKKQVDGLRQMLAFACAAVKQGAAEDPVNKAELSNIESEAIAVEFDRIKHKEPDHVAFSSTTDKQIADFYKAPGNEIKFNSFLESKIALLKRSGAWDNREVTADERLQAKDVFAKVRIEEAEARFKAKTIDPNFWKEVGVNVKLQQAQFLSKIYSDSLSSQGSVSDSEIKDYIAAHPDFDTASKKAKAEGILSRAKAGEDFAKLANEYTDDPGNKDSQGKPRGGLYAGVPKGVMVQVFEDAALALNPGDISPHVVESDFGYHIIKLEKKAESKQADGTTKLTYDVRHILVSTMWKDPANAAAQPAPLKTFVRDKLETKKQDELTAKVLAENPVEVADIPVARSAAVKKPVATHRSTRRRK